MTVAPSFAILRPVASGRSITPPPGTLIVNVFTRILDRDEEGDYRPGTSRFPGGDRPARDHLWLLPEEWQALIPADARVGQTFAVPRRLVQRIARFHLVDNTRGEPPMWTGPQVRSAVMTLTVEQKNDRGIRLRLEGKGLLATAAQPDQADRGFQFALLGFIHYDVPAQKIDRFDAVVVGDHWGEGPFTRHARPGRTPLGIAFRLAGSDAADRVPPQAARSLAAYLRPDEK